MEEINKQKILGILEMWKGEGPLSFLEWGLWMKLLKHKAHNFGQDCKIILTQENKFYCERCQRVIE